MPEEQRGISNEADAFSWWKSWPIFLGVLMLCLNVEMVIMNILKFRYGITGWNLFYAGAILGNVELSIWVWLLGKIGIFIKQNPGFRLFYSNVKSRGIDKIFRQALKTIADKLDPENLEYLEKIKNIKAGYFGMFQFGICIGAWIFGIIIFRTIRRYDWLAMMMLGNTIKLGFFAFGYSSLSWLFIPILILTFVYKIRKVLI